MGTSVTLKDKQKGSTVTDYNAVDENDEIH